MEIETERKMVAAAAAGDREAMAVLVGEYRGLLEKAAHMGKVRTVAEDALGVATAEFIRAVRGYDAGRGVNFAAYAKSMVYAAVHQFFRQELRHWQHEFSPFERGEEDAPAWEMVADSRDDMGAWEQSEDLEQAFSCLTERERSVIELTFLQGFSQKRAAELLCVRIQTVNGARRRALRKLREYFLSEGNLYGRCLA